MKVNAFTIVLLFVVSICCVSCKYRTNDVEQENVNLETPEQGILNDLEQKAIAGDARSQFALGCYYETGSYGYPQSKKDAVRWYIKAAEQGEVYAQYNLASLYFKDGPQMYSEAFRWMKKSAEQGYDCAQCMLGIFYLKGFGCMQDVEMGLEWLERAANQGNQNAIEALDEIDELVSSMNS